MDQNKNIAIAGSLMGSINDDMGAGRFFDTDDNYGGEFVIFNVTHTYDMSTLTNIEPGIPNSFNLYQNYPNPFNPSTSIKFDFSTSSIVRISVYDALGREISTPVNEYLVAGTYEISVSMSSLSSGVYFYKMTSGAFSDIKNLVLIK